MNRETPIETLTRFCKGDAEALDFLVNHWFPYCHEIDDIVDGARPAARDQILTFTRAALLFSHPFYLRNLGALRQIVLNLSIAYADSVMWEKSETAWQREWADAHRCCGNEMTIAVAGITGGLEHAFSVSLQLRQISYAEHHTAEGKPI